MGVWDSKADVHGGGGQERMRDTHREESPPVSVSSPRAQEEGSLFWANGLSSLSLMPVQLPF